MRWLRGRTRDDAAAAHLFVAVPCRRRRARLLGVGGLVLGGPALRAAGAVGDRADVGDGVFVVARFRLDHADDLGRGVLVGVGAGLFIRRSLRAEPDDRARAVALCRDAADDADRGD